LGREYWSGPWRNIWRCEVVSCERLRNWMFDKKG
jgi:hypothetical protein